MGGSRSPGRRHAQQHDPRRHAQQCERHLRRHARCADGRVDAAALRARLSQLLDLRRALQHRQDAPPRQGGQGVRRGGGGRHHVHAEPGAHRRLLCRQGGQALRLAGYRHDPALRHGWRAGAGPHAHAGARHHGERARQAHRVPCQQYPGRLGDRLRGGDQARHPHPAYRLRADGERPLRPLGRGDDAERRASRPHPQHRPLAAAADRRAFRARRCGGGLPRRRAAGVRPLLPAPSRYRAG